MDKGGERPFDKAAFDPSSASASLHFGNTRSGKPITKEPHKLADIDKWSSDDHADAARAHTQKLKNLSDTGPEFAQSKNARDHFEALSFHKDRAGK